ncbi:MAG: hypothetical protein JJ913_06110 [Rhizobiaceae bacterium]|nr:hypothetical protein [Rhizobiaceae bacterium]
MKILISALLAGAMAINAGGAWAQACNLPPREIKGEAAQDQYQAIEGFVLENLVGTAQDLYADRVIGLFVEASKNADNTLDSIMLKVDSETVGLANNWLHALKVATLAKAVAQGEIDPVKDWVVDEAVGTAVGKFAEAIGATSNGLIIGSMITSLKTVKESYETLEHEDCLLNVDMGFYRFLDDPKLRWSESGEMPAGAVDHYILNYLVGGGSGPYGSTRAENRRVLQCFINLEMPESERIDVSSMGPGSGSTSIFGWFADVFGEITDVLGSAADAHPEARRLRTPVNVMLRDFNYRADVEEESEKLGILLRSDEYAVYEALLGAMETSAKTAAWLCGRLSGPDPEITGNWTGTVDFTSPWAFQLMLELDVAPDGAMSGALTMNDEQLPTTEHTLDGREASFRAVYSVTENGKTADVMDFHFKGEVEEKGGPLAGEVSGTIVDMECVMEGLFGDEEDQNKECALVPASGMWSAARN